MNPTTSRYDIARYWAETHPKFVIDLGEPSCFACGYYESRWDNERTAKQCWDKSSLERAHIIADSIGGKDEPSNYLLLCRRCHLEAPMTNNPELMVKWAESEESHVFRTYKEQLETLQRYGITEEILEEVFDAGMPYLHSVVRDMQADSHPMNLACRATVAVVVQEASRRLRSKPLSAAA